MRDILIVPKRSNLFVLETIFGLFCLAAINLVFFPKDPAFVSADPNPLWIIVLGISARYGRKGALFSGALTALFFIAYIIFARGVNVIYDDLWLMRFPFLFLLVGFMVGEVKTSFILREDYLSQRLKEVDNFNEKLKKENEIIKEAHKDLSIDVATAQDTITFLNEITTRLKSNVFDEIYDGILYCFNRYLEAGECSFYAFENGQLKLKKTLGWEAFYKRPVKYDIGQGSIGSAAKFLKVITIKDIVFGRNGEDGTKLDMLGDSVVAIPVIGPANELYGVASIEKIPLFKLTETAVRSASVICELAGYSINNSNNISRLKEKQILNEKTGVYKYPYFYGRLEEEFKRAFVYMLPLTVMLFRWEKISKLPHENKLAILRSAIAIIRSNLKEFDMLAEGTDDRAPLIAFLATTTKATAETVKKKMIESVKEYKIEKLLSDSDIESSIALADFSSRDVKNTDELLERLADK